jgi:probable HAF family extracellular repeat protein
MMKVSWALCALCVSASASAQTPPPVTHYYVYDVGATSTGDVWSFRLNQQGQMIWNGNGHAYVFQNCQSRDLGHLGGGRAVASGINNNGVIVGRSQQAGGRWRAFRYVNGTMYDLGGSTSPQVFEAATAVNFWGDVVGIESVQGTLSPTAVRYQGTGVSPMARILLHPPEGWSPVTDVVDLNDSRDVVGTIVDGTVVRAFVSTNFGALWAPLIGVHGLEFATFPRAMNVYGHVAGIAGNGFTRAFISRDPAAPATDLGSFPEQLSFGLGINNYDWVVGWAEQTPGGGPRAFVHDTTRMIDLNTVLWNGNGWLLREAFAINDAGQIVGQGLHNGQTRAFFLQPMARPPIFNPCTVVAQPLSTPRSRQGS